MNDSGLPKPWYRETYVWLVIAFPLSAVLAGIVTIIIAVKSDDGLVVDDYYKHGKEINLTLKRDRKAELYKLNLDLQLNETNDETRAFLSAAEGFNFPAQLDISYLYASRSGFDQTFSATKSNVAYSGKHRRLQKGKWHVLVEADDWRLLRVVHIP